MPAWLAAPLVVVGVVLLFFAWGFSRLRRNGARIRAAFREVSIEDIPALAERCASVLHLRAGVTLDAADPTAAARALDHLILSGAAQTAFARPGLEWAYALHCGAWLGELLRGRAGGRWLPSEDGAPALQLGESERDVMTFPFEKILKHRWEGDPGDLVAYVAVALQGPDRLIEESRSGTDG